MLNQKEYVLKNFNFDKEVLELIKKLGVRNLSDFVRSAVDDKIREMQLQSLKERYQSEDMAEMTDDFDCTTGDGL
ncbi:MAG TPA: hypothetical protein PLW37_00075 [bacterium]|jgi:hypothetical protein|nr:hypothetical protein [bacterium]HNZ53286.1 hypothetical protein [bacterium]HPG35161.1 hypothetical protein [bacterium]HPM46036.1 hypothetical protein [bacterium]HPV20225.1 hypothetical protein [bacterium]